ncbi:MAG TPA: TatD family hydrolase [Chloroflexota bacterium]|jgi:TatD DNase family protein|nr:TatD family hydrolase [Chloroflexota bacterium]
MSQAQGLVDTHAHLMDHAFDADRPAVLARAAAAGVEAMILVGYDLPSSRAAVDLASRLPDARATVGIHPNSAAAASADDFAALAMLARDQRVVAIGETGLDYYREYTPPGRQREALAWHLRLAEELALPVIVHNRQADADLADLLTDAAAARRSASASRIATAATADTVAAVASPPGLLHCFSSTDPTFLAALLEAGYFVSFAGTLTFKSAGDLRAMAQRVPLDRLLVETDCPYLAPVPHRGQRNEPAFVKETAVCLADVLGLDFETLQERLWTNSLQVFPALQRLRQEVA